MTLEKARREAGAYSREMAEGKSISDLRKAKNSELTFTKLFELYLERHAKSNKRTWQEDQTKFDMHIKSAIGNRKLSTITRREIAGIHSDLSQASKPTTANRVLALISSVFGWAAKSGLWDDNPAKGVVRNRETSRDRFLQRDELPRFYAAVMAEPNETIRDFFLMALFTGARRANVLAMHSRELDLEMAEWRIPRTKNDDPQIVTLVPEAVEIVRNRRIPAGGGFVFPGAGREGHLHEPRKGWERVLARAHALGYVRAIGALEGWNSEQFANAERKALEQPQQALTDHRPAAQRHEIDPASFALSDLRIHDLRRTLGSWQAKTGASLSIIGKSLNHRNVSTTQIYARLDQDPVRESVARATSAMLEAAGAKEKAPVLALKKLAKK
jgi:integrase